MNDVMGIVYTSRDSTNLRELASNRAVSAIPIACRYRIVDFTLSNLVNSGIRNVGVITQKNYHSLMDHLGAGKEWDLHTRNNGLFILPPFVTRENNGEYSGLLDALRSNVDYLRRSRQTYVLVTNSDYVCNTTFDALIQRHIDSHADITMLYMKPTAVHMEFSGSAGNHTYLDVDDTGIVRHMEVNPNAASYPNLSMDVFVIKRTLLLHLVDRESSSGRRDLEKDVFRRYVENNELKMMAYPFEGYYRRIETIKGYFNFNLDLLNADVRHELFYSNPIYTKTRDDVPALYREGSRCVNSLVADGCIIEGDVENCILFRGVQIGKGAHLRNCIIMQDCYIENNVELENVIFDKNVTIRSHGRLIGERQYPIVVAKNVTL